MERHPKGARLPVLREIVKSGRHTPPLRAFLAGATAAVRRVYHGPISYSALRIEDVDCELFDVVGINHYWNTGNAHRWSPYWDSASRRRCGGGARGGG
jgi:hypothetical protein